MRRGKAKAVLLLKGRQEKVLDDFFMVLVTMDVGFRIDIDKFSPEVPPLLMVA